MHKRGYREAQNYGWPAGERVLCDTIVISSSRLLAIGRLREIHHFRNMTYLALLFSMGERNSVVLPHDIVNDTQKYCYILMKESVFCTHRVQPSFTGSTMLQNCELACLYNGIMSGTGPAGTTLVGLILGSQVNKPSRVSESEISSLRKYGTSNNVS